MIKEIHGVADVLIGTSKSQTQYVLVVDNEGYIDLVVSYPSRLTPEQARKIAGDLIHAANRVEKQSENG